MRGCSVAGCPLTLSLSRGERGLTLRWFGYADLLVDRDILQRLGGAARPEGLQLVDSAKPAEAEVRFQGVRGEEARAAADLPNLTVAAGGRGNLGANAAAITLCPDELNHKPVVTVAGILQERRRLVVVGDEQVEEAVAVKVGDREPTGAAGAVGRGQLGNVAEGAVAAILE